MMIATIAVGIMVAFASCKDNKRSHADDEDDEDDIESVEGDLDDEIDEDDLDVAELEEDEDTFAAFADIKDMDDLKNLDVNALSSDEANDLLKFATKLAQKELPEDMGDGMEMIAMALEGDDVSFHVKVNEASLGMTVKDFATVLEMPEMKQQMMSAMAQGVDDDMTAFMKIVKKAGKNLAMKFVNDATGDMAVLRITNDELHQFIK